MNVRQTNDNGENTVIEVWFHDNFIAFHYHGWIACSEVKYGENEKHTTPKAVAQYAVACADALIDELRKGGEK